MQNKPEILVFAGPNGSGKSTITQMTNIVGTYINADDIKMSSHCSDLEAAQIAESLRNKKVASMESFTFETVLSTKRNLDLLRQAKEKGYFIRCVYVLTSDPEINMIRVMSRTHSGGHFVPNDKIESRYYKALALIPELLELCDICHIYDNSDTPSRIYKKRKDQSFAWPNGYWPEERILKLVHTK